MSKTKIFDPGTSEVKSPIIAGLTEGLSKLTDILNLKTDTSTITLQGIPITDEDKNRIYQAANGKRLWLDDPAPIIYKNGKVITETSDFFEIDYIGGSISFDRNYRLKDSDVVTARVTYLVNQSNTINDINTSLDDIKGQKPVLIYASVPSSAWSTGKVVIHNDGILAESKYFYILGFPSENVETYEGGAIWADDVSKPGEMTIRTKLEQEDDLNFVIVRYDRVDDDPQSTGAKVISQILGGSGGGARPASISIANPPTRTEYYAGDIFENDGMIVEVVYDNGFTTETTSYTWEPSGPLEYGTENVTIILKESGKTVTVDQPITVIREEVAVPYQEAHLTFNRNVQQANFVGYDTSKMSITSGYTSRQNAGNYSAVFTLSSVRYEWPDHTTDDKEINWVIDKRTVQEPTDDEYSVVYSGDTKTYSPTYDYEYITADGDFSGVNAGAYDYSFSLTYPESTEWSGGGTAKIDRTWTIERFTITKVPSADAVRYTESEVSPEWKDYDPTQLEIGGQQSGTEPGPYTATFTPIQPNYQWEDGDISAKGVEWRIFDPTIVVTIPKVSGSITYNGGTQKPVWVDFDEEHCDISGEEEGVDAKTYTAIFTLHDDCAWTDGKLEPKEIEWTIDRATIESVPTQSVSLSYTGDTLYPTWDTYDPAKLELDGDTEGVDAKEYTAEFTPTSNYKWFDEGTEMKEATWTINKANVDTPVQSPVPTYTGLPITPTFTNYDENKMDWDGDKEGTDANTYNAKFTPKDNYQWTGGGEEERSVEWKIDKAIGTLSVVPDSVTFNTSKKEETVSIITNSTGALSAQSQSTSIAEAEVIESSVRIYSVSETTGETTVVVSVEGDNNHTKPEDFNVKITAQFLPFHEGGLDEYTWEEISTISKAGKASDYFETGDTKHIMFNGTDYEVQIIGFDHDDVTDAESYGREKAGITFQFGRSGDKTANSVYSVTYAMNKTATSSSPSTNVGGWSDSDMRKTTMPLMKGYLPTSLRNVIVPVNKAANVGGKSDNTNTVSDELWLIAPAEASSSVSAVLKREGTQYQFYAANIGTKTIRYESGKSVSHWTRSASSFDKTNFCYAQNNGVGYEVTESAGTKHYISFCFCV